MLIHYSDLKRDLSGSIRSIASFLDFDIPPGRWPAIVEHSTFEYMKKNADKVAPLGGDIFEGGAGRFVYKGTNGRWRDILTEADCRHYEDEARRQLGEECARWVAEGGDWRG
jgi:aryl sulfotransferase